VRINELYMGEGGVCETLEGGGQKGKFKLDEPSLFAKELYFLFSKVFTNSTDSFWGHPIIRIKVKHLLSKILDWAKETNISSLFCSVAFLAIGAHVSFR